MDEIKNKAEVYTPNELPHHLIEEHILSRLPFKSLLRFRAVSNLWKATISDPKFAETHLRRQSKTSRRLLARVNGKAQLVDFENDEFGAVTSAVDSDPPVNFFEGMRVFCECDGLLLFPVVLGGPAADKYILWNPSTRAYKELYYPYSSSSRTSYPRFGICYDPLVMNYKVVIGDDKHYAVFYCKSNSWSEMKETDTFFGLEELFDQGNAGAPYNGSIYWLFFSEEADDWVIVYFDGRDEKLKNLRKLDDGRASVSSLRDGLCLFPFCRPIEVYNEIRFKKIVGDAWMEIKVKLPFNLNFLFGVFRLGWTHENRIILKLYDGNDLLYDQSKTYCTEIQNSSTQKFSRLLPYVENLFLL